METLTNEQLATFREKLAGTLAGVYSEAEALGFYEQHMPAALAEIDAMASRLSTVEAANAELVRRHKIELEGAGQRAEAATATVRELLREFAEGCAPEEIDRAGKGFVRAAWRALGRNEQRSVNLAWAAMKARELGLPWPLPADDYTSNLPSARAVPLEAAVPAADSHCCHGHSLDSHRKLCQSSNCDHKRAAPTTTGEGKEQAHEEADTFICSCGAELYQSDNPQQCACLREHAPAAPLSAGKLAAFGYEGDNSSTTTE